jgi:hypothetical protein
MARRHFDSKGFPKLKEITKEICDYVEGLEVEYTDFPISGNVIDSRNTKYGEEIISSDVDFVQGIAERPFKVTGIYVVGGQVPYLPDSYNVGEHDLDMIIKTNADRVTFSPEIESQIWIMLSNVLEDGKGYWIDRNTKEFVLDLFDGTRENPLKPPYLQIYPVVKKVDS